MEKKKKEEEGISHLYLNFLEAQSLGAAWVSTFGSIFGLFGTGLNFLVGFLMMFDFKIYFAILKTI